MHVARAFPPSDGVEHLFVDAGGVQLHVACAGPADGPVIVLLHGWPEHWWLWREVIPALAHHGMRVLAPDLRGFGWSEATRGGYDKEQLASDVLALMDAMGIESFDLVGHDWGGWIAQLVALRSPQRVRHLALLNIAPVWQTAGGALRHLHRLAYQPMVGAPVLGPMLHRSSVLWWAVGRMGMPPVAVAEFRQGFRERGRAVAGSKVYRTFVSREVPAILRGRYEGQRLTVPTRVLFGLDDPAIVRAMLDDFARHADDLVITDVPECSHFIVDERPARVVQWLQQTLTVTT
ncbi:epoxide hydrolase [Nocardia mangyaensis]|uniref:Epoxide hydrolase n=1 Tax=Nocardia mangyaensis TaxID=2213200 RepID=A0A1J0W149_9NOCA|nr:epoxide hydrolase [Nocardia mangyaensis]